MPTTGKLPRRRTQVLSAVRPALMPPRVKVLRAHLNGWSPAGRSYKPQPQLDTRTAVRTVAWRAALPATRVEAEPTETQPVIPKTQVAVVVATEVWEGLAAIRGIPI